MSKNHVIEGWLTKSPPSTIIWKTKWRRRWFCLRQSDELPDQYFLDYYASRTCRRLKGSIDLDCCDKVQAGLYMERRSKVPLNPKQRGSIFTLHTKSRTYHLEAESEFEMANWVDAICRVCNFEVSDETPSAGVYQNHPGAMSRHERKKKKKSQRNAPPNAGRAQSTGPYIAISECITGVRSQNTQRAFSFDPKDILSSIRNPLNRNTPRRLIPPEIRINGIALSEYEANAIEEECRPLRPLPPSPPQSSRYLTVTGPLSRLSINPPRPEVISEQGPPVPPRPPKTLARLKDLSPTDSFYVSKDTCNDEGVTWIRVPLRVSRSTSPLPSRRSTATQTVSTDDEEDTAHSMQYCNLSPVPPAVDRALKPRPANSSASNAPSTSRNFPSNEEPKTEAVLQYLDLDLPSSQPGTSSGQVTDGTSLTTTAIIHGKSSTKNEDYKTVDFVKTEAFNITRQDAEATRSYQQ